MQPSNNERATRLAIQEREIDEILADSFPASDAPPWTLGVQAQALHCEPSTKRGLV
ncbi:MAG: hypothetical protein ACREX3_03350 [Gammaproteobacteria bacterium]